MLLVFSKKIKGNVIFDGWLVGWSYSMLSLIGISHVKVNYLFFSFYFLKTILNLFLIYLIISSNNISFAHGYMVSCILTKY